MRDRSCAGDLLPWSPGPGHGRAAAAYELSFKLGCMRPPPPPARFIKQSLYKTLNTFWDIDRVDAMNAQNSSKNC